ncbi:MAG TPA: hypothetical protein VFQ88_02120 [Nevskiaceae bacterium]|nr:hypothetical protein [Nevskiaceae bacterium]
MKTQNRTWKIDRLMARRAEIEAAIRVATAHAREVRKRAFLRVADRAGLFDAERDPEALADAIHRALATLSDSGSGNDSETDNTHNTP